MMSKKILMTAAVALAVLGLHPGRALANRLLYPVTGKVTATPVGHQITINGRTYRIMHGSAAVRQAQQILQGDAVQVVLTAPAGSKTAKVVAIHAVPRR